MERHLDPKQHIFRTSHELSPPALDDEDEGDGRWQVVENPKHTIIVRECNEKILRVESLDLEAITWDVEPLYDPSRDLRQGHRRPRPTRG
jgi:hypothetical protein